MVEELDAFIIDFSNSLILQLHNHTLKERERERDLPNNLIIASPELPFNSTTESLPDLLRSRPFKPKTTPLKAKTKACRLTCFPKRVAHLDASRTRSREPDAHVLFARVRSLIRDGPFETISYEIYLKG